MELSDGGFFATIARIVMATQFSKLEQDILAFWNEKKIFDKTLTKESPKGDYVFYDGPPFATGLPHYGHIVASVMKDVVPRYWTMRGYHVARQWGWDCHGLPIENIIEQELHIKNKRDIEIMANPDKNELVLYTCWPPDSIANRYVVYAKPASVQNHLLSSNN